jgi:hypothetical protein
MNTNNKDKLDKLFDTFKNENLRKRKLKATWTVDAKQDLRSFLSIEAEAELSKLLLEDFKSLKEEN